MSKKAICIVSIALAITISYSAAFANESIKTKQNDQLKKECPKKLINKNEPVKQHPQNTQANETKSVPNCKKNTETCTGKKVVYVNIDLIWKTSSKGKEELEKLDKNLDESKAEALKRKKELEELKQQYDKNSNEQEKIEISKKIDAKRKELLDFGTLKTKEIELCKNRAQNDFISEIMPIINKYREDNGFKMIKRFNANEVLSIDPKIDVTQQIMELYKNK